MASQPIPAINILILYGVLCLLKQFQSEFEEKDKIIYLQVIYDILT